MEIRNYPPEEAQHLWLVGWDSPEFSFLVADGQVALFGSQALRGDYALSGCDGVRTFIRRGEIVLLFPESLMATFKQRVKERLLEPEKFWRLDVTRDNMASAIRGYRRRTEGLWPKWDAEDSSKQLPEPTQ